MMFYQVMRVIKYIKTKEDECKEDNKIVDADNIMEKTS
jgi:hypothetical protein